MSTVHESSKLLSRSEEAWSCVIRDRLRSVYTWINKDVTPFALPKGHFPSRARTNFNCCMLYVVMLWYLCSHLASVPTCYHRNQLINIYCYRESIICKIKVRFFLDNYWRTGMSVDKRMHRKHEWGKLLYVSQNVRVVGDKA